MTDEEYRINAGLSPEEYQAYLAEVCSYTEKKSPPDNFWCKIGLHKMKWEMDYGSYENCWDGICLRCGKQKHRIYESASNSCGG